MLVKYKQITLKICSSRKAFLLCFNVHLMFYREAIRKAQNPEALLASVISEKVIDTGIHFHPSLNQAERYA